MVAGIVISMLVVVIAYNLFVIQNQMVEKQSAINQFNNLISDVNTVCIREIGNRMTGKVSIYPVIKLIYATDDIKTVVPENLAIEYITEEKISEGEHLCMQLDEESLRCEKAECKVKIPYLGTLPITKDIWLMVKKILRQPLVRDVDIYLMKTSGNLVSIGLQPIVTTTTTIPIEICANEQNEISKDKCKCSGSGCRDDITIDLDCNDGGDLLCVEGDEDNCCERLGDTSLGQCLIWDPDGVISVEYITFKAFASCHDDLDIWIYYPGGSEQIVNNMDGNGVHTVSINREIDRIDFCIDHGDCDHRFDWIKYKQ